MAQKSPPPAANSTSSGGGGGRVSGDWPNSACQSRPDRLRKDNQNVRIAKTAVYLSALIALERSQGAVSEFNVKDGDIAAVAHSSTGQPVALLLLQRRHLATVPTTRTVS